jgi:hypothetical protein
MFRTRSVYVQTLLFRLPKHGVEAPKWTKLGRLGPLNSGVYAAKRQRFTALRLLKQIW